MLLLEVAFALPADDLGPGVEHLLLQNQVQLLVLDTRRSQVRRPMERPVVPVVLALLVGHCLLVERLLCLLEPSLVASDSCCRVSGHAFKLFLAEHEFTDERARSCNFERRPHNCCVVATRPFDMKRRG